MLHRKVRRTALGLGSVLMMLAALISWIRT
jgi:hypothetical protein